LEKWSWPNDVENDKKVADFERARAGIRFSSFKFEGDRCTFTKLQADLSTPWEHSGK
jgi:hypothetical protein